MIVKNIRDHIEMMDKIKKKEKLTVKENGRLTKDSLTKIQKKYNKKEK